MPVVPLALHNLWGSYFSRVEAAGRWRGRSAAACSAASGWSAGEPVRAGRASRPAELRERVAGLLAAPA